MHANNTRIAFGLGCRMGLYGCRRNCREHTLYRWKRSAREMQWSSNPPWTLNSRICVKCTSFGEQPCHSCLTLASPKQFKIIPRRLTSESKETILKQVSRNVDWKKPCQLCCLWEETHDIDPKIGLAWQEAELTLNKCSGNVMKRAIRMLLFVCLETQQLPDTPNQRWMTALPCPIWRPCAGSPLSCSLIGTSHAYHLMIFQNLYTALQRQDTSNKLASCWGKNFNSNSAIPPFSIFKLSSSASVCQTMEKKTNKVK